MDTRRYKLNTEKLVKALTIKRVIDFTYSNTSIGLNERKEVEGYQKVIDYFWINARARLRENETNLGYLNRIDKRLSEIRDTNKSLSGLCSKIINKISKCELE